MQDKPSTTKVLSPSLGRAASAVVIAAALPPLLLFVLSLSRLRSATTLDQLLTYVLLPAAIATGLLASIRLRAEMRLNLALFLAAIATSVLVAEAALLQAQASRASVQSPGASPSMADGVRQLRREGVDAFPTIPGNILVDRNAELLLSDGPAHPISPAPASTTAVLCDESAQLVTYEADRFGFNNPDAAWDAQTVEVALVGDSYVHGVCVNAEYQLATLISREYTTINVGARGAGGHQELAILKEYASTVEPRVVVWVYYEGNDRYDIRREAERPWLTAYTSGPSHRQSLAARQSELDVAYRAWIDSLLLQAVLDPAQPGRDRVAISDILRLRALRSALGFGVVYPSVDSPIGRLPEILATAADEVDSWGGSLYLVYLPSYERYRTLFGEGVPGRGHVIAAADSLGIPLLDLTSVFADTGRPRELWAHPRGHLSEAGYQLVAEQVLQGIRSEFRD